MIFSRSTGASLLALCATTFASPLKVDYGVSARQDTCGSATNRQCWPGGFSVGDDTDAKWPTTGQTRTYTFTVSEQVMSPDGVDRPMMVINGQYPGPTIEADWGDDIIVTVINTIQTNGTSIHWHGFRQFNNNKADGTNGLTECPIAPGVSKTYRFKATAYGTSWYHSHYSSQYADGVVGGIVIRGPATANYDIDLGFYSLTDWFHTPFGTVAARASHAAGPPAADNILINGTMKTTDASSAGNYAVTTLTPGKKHMLRLINIGINNYMHVALDGHKFTIVSMDFVAVEPTTVDNLVLAVGQRYDVIIEPTNATTDGNYWLRVGPGEAVYGQGACDGPNPNAVAGNTKAIFRYAGSPEVDPTSQADAPLPIGCHDQAGLVPYFQRTIPQEDVEPQFSVSFSNQNNGLVQWLIDGSPILIDFNTPTLKYIQNDQTPPASYNAIKIDGASDKFSFWHIQWVAPTDGSPNAQLPHPIHLHGHDFYVLGSGAGVYGGDGTDLQLNNPVRRDTATLPAGGYLIIAFPTDNPGAWLMHCHIPFHVAGGLAKQFIENEDKINKADLSNISGECDGWSAWTRTHTFSMVDSGL